jgi:hypothetical protein
MLSSGARCRFANILALDQLTNAKRGLSFLRVVQNHAVEVELSQNEKRAESCDSARSSFKFV